MPSFETGSGIQTMVERLFRGWPSISILLLTLAVAAFGSPIQPDIQKLLSAPQAGQERFAPARAGWDGPEADSRMRSETTNLTLARFGPEATQREVRESFIAAALPDPRIWGFLVLLILLLRSWLQRKIAADRPPSTADTESNELVRRAA